MRVALLSGEYPPLRGGVADYTALLAAALGRHGVEVSVLTSARATPRGDDGVVRVYPSLKSWGAQLWRDVSQQLDILDPDVLHIQYQTGAFEMKIGVNVLPWLNRLRRLKLRTVVTYHDLKQPYLLPKLGPIRHAATWMLGTGADAVIATTAEDFHRLAGSANAQTTRWTWAKRPLAIVPIGSNIPTEPPGAYDRRLWRESLSVREDECLVAFFGFLGPSKGIHTLITAFERLVQRGVSVRLLMIGASTGDTGNSDWRYVNSIRQRLDEPEIRGKVGWTGYIGASDVAGHLRAADVCVLPFKDGASLRHGTLIAALTQHLPIVTTAPPSLDAPAGFPALRSGENCLLVPPEEPERLAEAIEDLVNRPGLRSTLAGGAAQLAEAFRWDSIALANLRLYQVIL